MLSRKIRNQFLFVLFFATQNLYLFSEIKTESNQILYLPLIDKSDVIHIYSGFSFLYNEKHKQASWVAYELTKEEAISSVARRLTTFKEDPGIVTGQSKQSDYYKSGYDRGHLAPAADMRYSEQSMIESFYYSNISPQNPSFNRGIWAQLEETVRNWAIENESIFIVTGPVLSKEYYQFIGNKVSVPDFFFKVILDFTEPDKKAIGFIIPNSNHAEILRYYIHTIDEVEIETGLDFFPVLEDDLECILEATVNPDFWGL